MNIQVFQYKNHLVMAESVSATAHKEIYTEIITVDAFKKVFLTTQCWKKLWRNVEALLKTSWLKDIVLQQDLDTPDAINMTSKLEVGTLALLWCEGTQSEKAEYLVNLVQPDKEQDIALDN